MDLALPSGIAGLPTWLALLVTIGAPLALALLIGHAIFQLFTPRDFQLNAQVGAVKFTFIVEVYAVVAALSLVGAWDIYQSTRDNVQRELRGLYLLALSVDTFQAPGQEQVREEMRSALRGYALAVVNDDWPAMRLGRPSTVSEPAFQRLVRAFLDTEPRTGAQEALMGSNLSEWVAQVAEARINRLSVMSRTLGGLIWFLVLTLSVAVIVFQWFFGGGSSAIQYAMGAVIVVIVGSVLLVALKLAYPFVGDAPLLSARPYFELLQVR